MKKYIFLILVIIFGVALFLNNSSASSAPDVCPEGTFEQNDDCTVGTCVCQGSGENRCCTCSCKGGACSTHGASCRAGSTDDECSWGKLKAMFA